MKTHFAAKPPFDTTEVSACGRGRRIDSNVYRVDCGLCVTKDAYILAKEEADRKKYEAFMAQVPRNFMEPWQAGKFMLCSSCGNGFFRIGDRTCYGHYQDYVCAKCGHKESRLTEKGMSF